MKKSLVLLLGFICFVQLQAQTITAKLQKAFSAFEKDPQMTHAIASLYVIDAKTGAVIYEKNANYGLAPASTQKTFTSTAALELLGQDYRYRTEIGLTEVSPGFHDIVVRGSGDPTFGSFRFAGSKPEKIMSDLITKLSTSDFKGGLRFVQIDNSIFETKNIPDGWIWGDIGNYYGAGAAGLNWRENQYDLSLKSAGIRGTKVEVISLNGRTDLKTAFNSEVTAAPKGTGDNAYIYLPTGNNMYTVRGTIPVLENDFSISGAIVEPASWFAKDLGDKVKAGQKPLLGSDLSTYQVSKVGDDFKPVYTYKSPALDSIVYWFLQKSINLYGECLLKTIAAEQQGIGRTDSGVAILKRFWQDKGIDPDELNIYDGSGLSPLNRVTTHAEVMALKYAKTRPWYPAFYQALPEYNGMKMKSGTISDVKGYCGYHTAKDGKEYIFSILVNNYSGTTSGVVSKMFKVLDSLK